MPRNRGASDAGVPGTGTPVADLSATDKRAIGDDHCLSPDYESDNVIDLPLSGQIQCCSCSKKGKDIRFLQESQYAKHRDTQHPQEAIIWSCAACHKEFEKLHGCRCHLPKCKGRKIWEGIAKFKCEESFLSQRGLSMHERHRYSAIRNEKRAQSTIGDIQDQSRYKHLKQPNVALREYFSDKTLKQISDKRRLLPVQEEEVATSGSETRSSPSESSEESKKETSFEKWKKK
ncbi:reverse transcriptase [Apis cerana cerana]|uniref:Reverse transcriptase n=1 Tax=Apis cerana cerana TaxID=94128 RepID=A0A2A3E0J5_APICC|nr:reverse transcriptase [Apis cerana cerana]